MPLVHFSDDKNEKKIGNFLRPVIDINSARICNEDEGQQCVYAYFTVITHFCVYFSFHFSLLLIFLYILFHFSVRQTNTG